jgi:hypothetical protein
MPTEKTRATNQARFIKNSKEKFGDKYDYSEVEYVLKSVPVTLTCKEHNYKFKIQPKSHYMSREGGCQVCSGWIGPRVSKEEFIRRATEKHKGKFSYEGIEYNGMNYDITLECPLHGKFTQQAGEHLKGGCNACRPLNSRLTQEEFVEAANKVHGGRYTYERTVYEKYETSVVITCTHHGDFLQTPHSHLNGRGCSKCRAKAYGWDGMQLYIFKDATRQLIKVGITKKTIRSRLWELNYQSKLNFEFVDSFYYGDGGDAKCIEKDMLEWMQENYEGLDESFNNFGGYSEIFKTSDTDAVFSMLRRITEQHFGLTPKQDVRPK